MAIKGIAKVIFFLLTDLDQTNTHTHTQTNTQQVVPEVGPHLTGSEPALDLDGSLVFLPSVFLSFSEGHKGTKYVERGNNCCIISLTMHIDQFYHSGGEKENICIVMNADLKNVCGSLYI